MFYYNYQESMSYLQKYHMKKVQPVKNRHKMTLQQLLKAIPKVQKTSVLSMVPKHKFPPPKNTFRQQQFHEPILIPKTQNIQRRQRNLNKNHNQNEPHKKQPQAKSRVQHQRSHKSLNFKSDKSQGISFISTLQGFFTKIMRQSEGCNCKQPCKYSEEFFRWADSPIQIVRPTFLELQRNWQEQVKQTIKIEQMKLLNNEQSQKTTYSDKKISQCRKNYIQIQKDIDRTQSQSPTFQNQLFRRRLKNILMCYSLHDPKVGYIQGMNMILSGILYHVKDQMRTFAVFRKIIANIRNIYFNNFLQCYDHIAKIKQYLKQQVNDLYELFQELGVDLNVVCLPWILSLLTSIVPLQHLHLIFSGFISQKWRFIYKACLSILIYHKQRIIQLNDCGDILTILSSTNENKHSYDWEDIVKFSKTIILQ